MSKKVILSIEFDKDLIDKVINMLSNFNSINKNEITVIDVKDEG